MNEDDNVPRIMKKIGFLFALLLVVFSAKSQQSRESINTYKIGSIEPMPGTQSNNILKNMPRINDITLPSHLFTSIYRKGSLDRTINIYGQSLIIESAEILSDGRINLVLRREDGRDFYNLYPTVKAELLRQNIKTEDQLSGL